MAIDFVIKLVLAVVVLFAVLNFAGLQTWVERKQSALMQDRIGANRATFSLPWRWAWPLTLTRCLSGPSARSWQSSMCAVTIWPSSWAPMEFGPSRGTWSC